MVVVENARLGYGDRTILDAVNFTAKAGEITVITAPSGEGKTTLLKAINRLHAVEENAFWMEGSIRVDAGEGLKDVYDPACDLYALRRRVAYIFQSPVVLPMSIEANVAFGLKLAGNPERDSLNAAVRTALVEAGLWDEVADRLDQSAEQLSLGQKQRLAIARALVLEPKILLFDEPTSSLDSQATERIEALMQRLKTTRTILLVSHDAEQVKRVADAVIGL
jgi:phosphate transport system ATP-binding protein